MISFFKYMTGYCNIKLTGPGKERFLNLCRNKKILIWNLKRQEDGYTCYVSYKAHKLLGDLSEKTNTNVGIEGKYGLPFFLYRYKKRKMFFLGLILSFFAIYVLSLFLWDIQVLGTEKYTSDEIVQYLTEKGIKAGAWKNTVDCPKLEEDIRVDFPDTAWVSCDIEGTLFTVHIKESIDTSDMEKNKNEVPNDMIASRDGIVESIVTRNGTPLVKKGDVVKQGDTLISGVIYIYNDYDELLETSTISADGDIKAVTEYAYEESFLLEYYEKIYTDNYVNDYQLQIGTWECPSFSRKVSYEKFDDKEVIHQLKIGKSLYLPVSLKVTQHREYTQKKVTLTKEQALEKANAKMEEYLTELKSEGKEIKNKDFKVDMADGECIIRGNVTVVESIGKIRNIP